MLIVDKNSFFKVGNMKKSLLIVLSLILASLLLVVACDDKVDPENPSIELPEGAPSLDPEDLDEITGDPVEPDESDLVLLQTVIEEIQGYLMTTDSYGDPELSDEATVILSDLVKAVGEKGIELEGEGYALKVSADIDAEKIAEGTFSITASASFDNFAFNKFTLDGDVKTKVSPNPSYNPETEKPFTFDSTGTSVFMTISEEEAVEYNDIGKIVQAVKSSYGEYGPSEEDAASIMKSLAALCPSLVESLNDFLSDYLIKTDLLTIALSAKMENVESIFSEEGIKSEKPITASLNATAYTNTPIEHNGSQYKVFAYGDVKTVIDKNPDYEKNPEKGPFRVKLEGRVNIILETSGKIGNQKLRLQLEVSGSNLTGDPSVDALLVINDKVIELSALVE